MAAPGALTRDELVALAKQALGGRSGGLMTDAWYIDRVNAAYARICTFQGPVTAPGARLPQNRVLRFFELYPLDSRTHSSGLMNNFITPTLGADKVVTVDDLYDTTNDKTIRRNSIRWMNRRNPDETGTLIRSWTPGGDDAPGYFIHPLPTAAVTVRERTYGYPDALTTDVAPVIPSAWHQAIWMAAAAEGALLIDWPEKEQEMEQRFINFIAQHRSPVEESGGAGGRRWYTVGGGSR